MPATNGPLTRSNDNPRYFADAAGRPVLLVGLHTWNNLQDMGPADPPPMLDFPHYLDVLSDCGHNFTRLWAWDMLCTWNERDRVAPFPWKRTGPGIAVDGHPCVDFTKLNEEYFIRLHDRVNLAARQGIYVSVMFFDSWGVQLGNRSRRDMHLFAAGNNVNGINILDSAGDGVLRAWCTLDDPAVLRIQEEYIRKVVESLNPCDNVLYEISNEGGGASHAWQEHLTKYVRSVEAGLPGKHPLGQTGGCGTRDRLAYASSADYLAPDGYAVDGGGSGYRYGTHTWGTAPFDRGDKVVILDTDHLWGIGGEVPWAWKSFCRGYNLLYMDPCTDQPWTFFEHPYWAGLTSNTHLRHAFGKIRHFAERMNLATSTPHNALSTTAYCLATPGDEYLVYQPEAGPFSLDLASGCYHAEWHWPSFNSGEVGLTIEHDDGWKTFPTGVESVLWLKKRDGVGE